MEHAGRNVFLLACCQALLFTNNVTLISLNGLAGFALADNKALATLPVTGYVVGAALSTFPASLWMKRVGRRNGFLTGTLFGLAGGAITTLAIWQSSFWTLVLGTLVLGTYNAFGQYYRFAAADASPLSWKARAISLVMAGGLVGGIIGPEMSKVTRDLVQPTFLASYASLMGFCLVTMAILAGLRIPDPKGEEVHGATRPLREIMAQPVFVVAVVVGALGYGVMNLLMTSTPLAMGFCGHPYAAAASVISAHVIAMFGPSFFTGIAHPPLRRAQRDDGGRRRDVRLRGHRPLGTARRPLLVVARAAGRGLELHVRGRHHAPHRGLPPGGEGEDAGSQRDPRLLHHGHLVLHLRRAGERVGLEHPQLRGAALPRDRGVGGALAGAQAPRGGRGRLTRKEDR